MSHLSAHSRIIPLSVLTPEDLERYANRTQAAGEHRHLAIHCLEVAEHMRKRGVAKALAYADLVAQSVDLSRFEKGQRIRIPANLYVSTTAPSGPRITGRASTVTLHAAYSGYLHAADSGYQDGNGYCHPSIVWAGAGGYWNSLDLNDLLMAED